MGLWAVVFLFCFSSGYPFQASLRYAFHPERSRRTIRQPLGDITFFIALNSQQHYLIKFQQFGNCLKQLTRQPGQNPNEAILVIIQKPLITEGPLNFRILLTLNYFPASNFLNIVFTFLSISRLVISRPFSSLVVQPCQTVLSVLLSIIVMVTVPSFTVVV